MDSNAHITSFSREMIETIKLVRIVAQENPRRTIKNLPAVFSPAPCTHRQHGALIHFIHPGMTTTNDNAQEVYVDATFDIVYSK